jgi:hypothetical protein
MKSKHVVSHVNGTRLELTGEVILEGIHVNCVLYVTHYKGERHLFTTECENEHLQVLFLGILYEVKKKPYPYKTTSLSLSVLFCR